MSEPEVFLDTNVLLYLLSADERKANRAEEIVGGGGGVISVQVLNEFASVTARKLRMPWPEIRESLAVVRSVCRVEPLSAETHDLALDLVDRHAFAWYDALIAASALLASCPVLYSEDFQNGLMIDGRVRVDNPFV
jgi:predicted nucleic acid-binding protein